MYSLYIGTHSLTQVTRDEKGVVTSKLPYSYWCGDLETTLLWCRGPETTLL